MKTQSENDLICIQQALEDLAGRQGYQSAAVGALDRLRGERDRFEARVAELEARVADIKKCLVQWRCHACGHELLEVPTPAFGPCPACGIESPYHHLFSDDRDALIQLLIYH